MKVSEEFLQAKKDKNVSSFIVFQRMEGDVKRTYMRLCIDVKSKYLSNSTTAFVETDTEIKTDNYSYGSYGNKTEVSKICFHTNLYKFYNWPCHIRTFLNAIKKDSDVKFHVVAFNSNQNVEGVKWTNHRIVGTIDNKHYLLADYTGPQNLASPVI